MAKTAILRARVESDKFQAAEKIFSKLGISVADAINLFLSQVSIHKGIPFTPTTRPHLHLGNASLEEVESRYSDRIPNSETVAAMTEPPPNQFKSAAQVLKSLKS